MATSTADKEQSTGVIPGEWHVRYNYSVGKYFDGLKARKILATRCNKSGLTYLPPRAYCERSFEACDGWTEAGSEGVTAAGISQIVAPRGAHLLRPEQRDGRENERRSDHR